MLGDRRFIRTIRLRNLLSYGYSDRETELESLNVLIGPNASGKSNLIEALGILCAAPRDLSTPIREGGGVTEWLCKNPTARGPAEIDVTVYYPDGVMPLRYRLRFAEAGQRFELVDEAIENERPQRSTEDDVYFFYRYQGGNPALNVRTATQSASGAEPDRCTRSIRREDMDLNQSVLSQRKDPDQYPEITYLGNNFSRIRLYREWNLGRYTPPRLPQKADMPEDFLLEDAGNLGLVLNDLQHRAETRQRMIEKLKAFYGLGVDVTTKIHGGTVQVFLHEDGLNEPIPATRLSDGTLRYLCLLTLLCHPTPPPLLCIEEPELGLHPDILPTIAELLVDASHRTQLIVTTHSDVLVSALSDVPESVLICERDDQGSRLRRLDKGQLEEWLERYTLGELWQMGEIGGTL